MTRRSKLGGALVALLSAGLGFLAGHNSSVSADSSSASVASRPPRFPPLTMSQLTDEQRPLAEAIMRISSVGGRLWRSQVEWYAHAPLALKAGLSPTIIADLKANKRPAAMQADEAVVYDFVMELSTKHAVSDETFGRAKQVLGEQQLVDLTAVTGTYVTVAMLLAMAEEGVPPGKETPFAPGDP